MQCESLEQLCNDPRARTAVLADMDQTGKEAQVTCSLINCPPPPCAYFYILSVINQKE